MWALNIGLSIQSTSGLLTVGLSLTPQLPRPSLASHMILRIMAKVYTGLLWHTNMSKRTKNSDRISQWTVIVISRPDVNTWLWSSNKQLQLDYLSKTVQQFNKILKQSTFFSAANCLQLLLCCVTALQFLQIQGKKYLHCSRKALAFLLCCFSHQLSTQLNWKKSFDLEHRLSFWNLFV